MSRSCSGLPGTMKDPLLLVKNDMDFQLNSGIKGGYLGKTHSEKPFVSADFKTVEFERLESVGTHFGRIFIAASIIASSSCQNCLEDNLYEAFDATAFSLLAS
jgi:hypothetical protein